MLDNINLDISEIFGNRGSLDISDEVPRYISVPMMDTELPIQKHDSHHSDLLEEQSVGLHPTAWLPASDWKSCITVCPWWKRTDLG